MMGFKHFCPAYLILGLICNLCLAQFPFQTQNNSPEEVFMLAPRALTRLLREGETAIQEGRYADGIAALSSLLLDDSETLPADIRGQDYFLERRARGLYNQSVKGEAIRLLGELPADGRQTLEIQFGVTARRELEQALQSRDVSAIANVARRYVHSLAAYEAQAIVAQHKLTSGYPLAAAGLLQELLRYPAARDHFGPRLALACAQAWMLTGNRDTAGLTMKLAAQQFPGQSLQVAGQQVALDVSTDWSQILSHGADASPPLVDQAANSSWLVSGGSPERNALSEGGMPLSTERWVKTIHSAPEQAALQQQVDLEAQKGHVLLPKFELRMINDLVLTKTTDASLLAIDFNTGNVKWPFYFHAAPVPLTNTPYAGSSGGPVSDDLQRRVWGSSAFGKFSCDTQRFFYVSEATDELLSTDRLLAGGSTSSEDSNYLEGVSIAAEGAILWRVGGETGEDEPSLAGSYFLGPPLPYQGDLYALVDIKGETKLVVLDAATGRLQWMQQLVHSTTLPLRYDPERKSQALSPTIAEGIILCPTGVGALAAVDMLSRSLRWGAAYPNNRASDNNTFRNRGAFGYGNDFSPLDRRWCEPAVIAQDGVVLLTPPESDEMFCFDILTGQQRMAPQRRNSARYVAGLKNGKIITVGERDASAIELGSGVVAWNCSFPRGHSLAGKGLWQADSVLLPLSDRTLIRVDTESGQITAQSRVATPLGNLFAYKGQLLSVDASSISVYYTQEALSEQVAQRLKQDQNDTWALNHQSQLLLAQGDIEDAIAALSRSYELDSENPDTRYLLVETLLHALSADFSRFEKLAQQYGDIVEFGPQRFEFLQQLALGKIRSGQHLEAFEQLLALMPSSDGSFVTTATRDHPLQLESGHTVESDVWIRSELARAYEAASAEDRQLMEQLVMEEIVTLENTLIPLRREQLRFLGWLPPAGAAVIQLARDLMGGDEQTIAEQFLVPLQFSRDPALRQTAVGLLRQPAKADERSLSAAQMGWLPLDPSLPGVPPNAQVDASKNANLQPATGSESQWNTGMLRMSVSNDGRYDIGAVVDVVSERYGRPQLAVRLSGSMVVLSNGNGDDVMFEYPRGSADTGDVFIKAVIRGGLLIIETSSEVAGFDIYRGLTSRSDALLWRRSLFTPGAGPTREFVVPDTSSVNTPLGFSMHVRQMPGKQQAIVGPLTPAGLVVQLGTDISLLDPLTGKTLWTRGGYDDRVQLAGHDLQVAIINPSMGAVEIVDCRDGKQLERQVYQGSWRTWFTHNGIVVDFEKTSSVPPPPTNLRVWNALTGEVLKTLELAVGSRADVCEGRFVAITEPDGKLHFFDLKDAEQWKYRVHDVKIERELESISLQRFESRLVVLTSGSKARRPSPDLISAHGFVYCLDAESGDLSWSRPGYLENLQFPRSQPRESPFMAVFRTNPKRGERHQATLALIDLRSGRLSYSTTSLPLRTNVGFAMNLRPARQIIELGLGTSSFTFAVTQEPRPPQPVFTFGHEYQQPLDAPGFDNLFPSN